MPKPAIVNLKSEQNTKIGCIFGNYDILREEDLKELQNTINLLREKDIKYIGLGIYEDKLCHELEMSKPLKSVEDRAAIMEQIKGVDFAFPISSLEGEMIVKKVKERYKKFIEEEKNKSKEQTEKKYNYAYAPGTYDLFHAGHLENLMIAANKCNKLIVGVKSDELVRIHKNKKTNISEDERMGILKHFKFVYDVYKYNTRDIHEAKQIIENKYGEPLDAIFLGSDLREDFSKYIEEGINIEFTKRDPNLMKERSTTAYSKKLQLGKMEGEKKYIDNNGDLYEKKQSIKSKNVKEQEETNMENNIEDDFER